MDIMGKVEEIPGAFTPQIIIRFKQAVAPFLLPAMKAALIP